MDHKPDVTEVDWLHILSFPDLFLGPSFEQQSSKLDGCSGNVCRR